MFLKSRNKKAAFGGFSVSDHCAPRVALENRLDRTCWRAVPFGHL
jgi:hypothetical protein